MCGARWGLQGDAGLYGWQVHRSQVGSSMGVAVPGCWSLPQCDKWRDVCFIDDVALPGRGQQVFQCLKQGVGMSERNSELSAPGSRQSPALGLLTLSPRS